ncbi:MAG: FecR domain-containing protein [Carboxylicivirga sp.]|jgi:ferric-dicitrate binding protein FerR (iron transport regulator)|nr:FecR domain-containing protein [Carboxylicivirga sp.]
MHDKKHIEQLLSDYCIGRISKGDAQILQQWVEENQENRMEAILFISIYRKRRAIHFLDNYSTDKVKHSIARRLSKRKRYRLVAGWASVAASIVMLLSIATMFYLFHDQPIEQRFAEQVKQTPWENKAILKLSSGEEIFLNPDSLQELRDENVMISQTKDKGLHYSIAETLPKQVPELTYNTLIVPRGGEYSATLSDGTRIWLNSESELRYPVEFTGSQREVYIKGEAYFDVVHKSKQPFIVHAYDVQTNVLGTSFNVNAYEADIIAVTLEEGKVQVNLAEQSGTLTPGMQANVDAKNGILTMDSVNSQLYTSWRNGLFDFEDITLEELSIKLSRWYDIDFVFESEDAKTKTFTGAVKRNRTLGFTLDFLEMTSNVQFTVDDKTIIIRTK